MLSAKVSLLALMLLATTLLLTIDHVALIEQELNSRVLATVGPGIVYANRSPSTCGPTSVVPKGHHAGSACPLNFVLSLSQKSLVQVQGTNSSVQLSVTLTSGVPVPVALSAQGVPPASEILFSPASARPSFTSTLTITTGVETHLGQFNITITGAGGGLTKSVTLSLVVVPIVHDIAVVSAVVPETATVGSIVSINATVGNYGSVSETFELRAYANTSLVAELSVFRLAPSAIYVDRLMWNTTGFSPGTYNVLVTVPPVQGELNQLDNTREAGKTLLTSSPGSQPSPSPVATGGVQSSNYGRQLAIVAAIAEAAVVFLVVLRSKGRASTGQSVGPRRV